MYDAVVVGAGAAGMMAAGFAARRGLDVILVERNARPGRKIMITGKGRCNVTNDCGDAEFLRNVTVNPRFLYGALSRFGTGDTMDFFEKRGVPLKVERGRRVFPQSDRAVDIVDALDEFVRKSGCHSACGRVAGLLLKDGTLGGARLEDGEVIESRTVILCTGGKSYPATGSTGDGYSIAGGAGHTIIPLKPSLVPIETVEGWPAEMQGLSLKNVTLRVYNDKKKTVFEELGEMMFTHFGVTGPLVLSASSHMRRAEKGMYTLEIDLKPGLDIEQLDRRLQRDFIKYANRDFANSLHELLPSTMVPVVVTLSGIDPQLKCNQITREMRRSFAVLLKGLQLGFKSFRPVEEAVVTSGGVKVSEVNPSTMESKLLRGLYFAGEILDVDAHTGGYNLQIAFSTGYTAGMSVLGE